MASDIDIASNALQMIGAKSISSFSDPGASASVASALYEPLLTALLTRTYWRFAIKKQTLNRLSQTPLNEWQYAFQLPTDNLKIQKAYQASNYQIYQNYLYANVPEVEVDYVFRVPESLFPAYFEQVFTYKLASEFALAVTDDLNKNQIYEQKYLQALGEAYAADAMQSPQVAIQDNPFTDIRFGGGIDGYFDA